MKKLYFSLLSIIFWITFWLNFVKGDIIQYPLESTYETEQKQVNFYLLSDIWNYIQSAALFVLVWFIISSIFLCFVFKKMWEKRWKAMIPIYNIYILFKNLLIKKKYFWILLIGSFILLLLSVFVWIYSTTLGCHNCLGPTTYRFSIFKIVYKIFYHIAWLMLIILILLPHYHLFRKFGWKKLTSILWTIFLPIWVCILWFGNYQYQWKEPKNSDEK